MLRPRLGDLFHEFAELVPSIGVKLDSLFLRRRLPPWLAFHRAQLSTAGPDSHPAPPSAILTGYHTNARSDP